MFAKKAVILQPNSEESNIGSSPREYREKVETISREHRDYFEMMNFLADEK